MKSGQNELILAAISSQIYFIIILQMCGRIFQALPLMRLMKIAKANKCTNGERHNASYNVCPTSYIPVIKPNRFYIEEKGQQAMNDEDMENQECRELDFMQWGHKGKHNMVINGRVEELLEKRMFVNIIKNRCVVIMEGYFEWNQKKEPFSLRPKEGDHFMVAGLYTDDNQIIIMTKDATPELAQVHHRMPVILSHEEVNVWMNPRNTKDIQNIINKSLLKKEKQVWKNVGFAKIAPHVSKINEKSIKCLMTIDDYKKELDKVGLMRFWKKAPAVQAVSVSGDVIKSGSGAPQKPKEPQKINPDDLDRKNEKKVQGEQSIKGEQNLSLPLESDIIKE